MRREWPLVQVGLLLAVLAGGTPASGKSIIINETSAGCTLTGNWADNQRNNPEGKVFSSAGLIGGDQHYTSSHGKFRRTGRETAVFKAALPKPGKYLVELNWRRSSNRSSKVTWEVRHAGGTTKKMINQRGSSDALAWTPLGTFEFGEEAVVAMIDDGGQSASVDAVRITPAGETPTGGGATLDDVIGAGTAGGGETGGGAAGEKTHTFAKDGSVTVVACLMTRGPAKLTVLKKTADGKESVWMSWSRRDDKDPSPCRIDGKPLPESMFEQNPGDFSPRPVEQTVSGKKGESLILKLEGDFGGETPTLEIRGE